MNIPVREMMTTDPAACVPEDNCRTALEIMRRRNCGFIPVVNNMFEKQVVGVVTDRDIALQLGRRDQPPSEVWVGGCMNEEVRTVPPDALLTEAADIMERAAVRRLPVVEDGMLVGVLSLDDIARLARKEWASSGAHLAERQLADILEAISAAQAR